MARKRFTTEQIIGYAHLRKSQSDLDSWVN